MLRLAKLGIGGVREVFNNRFRLKQAEKTIKELVQKVNVLELEYRAKSDFYTVALSDNQYETLVENGGITIKIPSPKFNWK